MYERRREQDIKINMTSSKSKLAKIKIKSKSQKSLSEPESRGGHRTGQPLCIHMYAYMQKVGGRK